MIAQAGDAPRQQGFNALTLADFAGDVIGSALVGGASHETQGLANFGFGDQVQIGGLLQLHGERLLQCTVED